MGRFATARPRLASMLLQIVLISVPPVRSEAIAVWFRVVMRRMAVMTVKTPRPRTIVRFIFCRNCRMGGWECEGRVQMRARTERSINVSEKILYRDEAYQNARMLMQDP